MYRDTQIIGQYNFLKKECEARGLVLELEEKNGESGFLIKNKEGKVIHISGDLRMSQGFLDGLDFASYSGPEKESSAIVWRFRDAPHQLQIPFNGGDEDYVVAAKSIGLIPDALCCLGCCSNDIYILDAMGVAFRIPERYEKESDALSRAEKTDWCAPAYKGWTVIIASHA